MVPHARARASSSERFDAAKVTWHAAARQQAAAEEEKKRQEGEGEGGTLEGINVSIYLLIAWPRLSLHLTRLIYWSFDSSWEFGTKSHHETFENILPKGLRL